MSDEYKEIARNLQVLNEQKRMLDLFAKNNVPLVVLKGTAAAMYYPRPEYRVLGDIDIIVKPVDFDKAFQLLETNYRCNQTPMAP